MSKKQLDKDVVYVEKSSKQITVTVPLEMVNEINQYINIGLIPRSKGEFIRTWMQVGLYSLRLRFAAMHTSSMGL